MHCNDHANDPSIDKKKKKKPAQGKEIPGFDVWFQRAEEPAEKLFIAFQTRHLRESVYQHSEKAELGLAESGQGEINERHGGHGIYTRRRA